MLSSSKVRVLSKGKKSICAKVNLNNISVSSFMIKDSVVHPSTLIYTFYLCSPDTELVPNAMITAPFPLQVPFVDLKITQKVNSNIFVQSLQLSWETYIMTLLNAHFYGFCSSKAFGCNDRNLYKLCKCVVWKWMIRTGNNTDPES